MLIPQQAQRKCRAGQGCYSSAPAELQASQAAPQGSRGLSQQRLLDLAGRLARVQALGDEYARVEFSADLATRARQLNA